MRLKTKGMNRFLKRPVFLFSLMLGLGLLLFSFKLTSEGRYSEYKYHSSTELALFDFAEFPTDTNTLFSGSGNCVLCHGPSNTANLDASGNDVSPVSTWAATMMANAAIDPFWRAKVKHEGLENPDLVDEIETLCATCHAPNGHFDAVHNGIEFYTISDLDGDPMGLDGVSCNACHMMENVDFGITFSGDITYNENHVEYGQLESPFQNPMINHTGFTPEYGSHISSSEACGKCHSLITETINESGELTGNSFVEQAVYHEWLNSSYSVDDTRCIDCHMTSITEAVKVSPMPPWLDPRTSFSKHDLVGGNVFMLNLLKNNSVALDLNATPAQFDSIISQTTRMLQERALNLEVGLYAMDGDSLHIEVVLENKSGHKLPSGYPARKMMIEFLLTSPDGDTLFRSGGLNDEGRVIGELDDEYEEHYENIYSEDQVQLYEYVMGNEAGDVTTILTRAYSPLKDNRIPPLGFSVNHTAYDTVKIVGNALTDANFNYVDDVEGSGKDKIYYHIALNDDFNGAIVNVKVHYMSIPRKWLDQLFSNDVEEINSFETMYDEVDMESVIMKEEEILVGINSIEDFDFGTIRVYPNPSSDKVEVISDQLNITQVRVLDVIGNIVEIITVSNSKNTMITLPETSGKYFLLIDLEEGTTVNKTVLKL